jgi:hypothetical protein
VIERDLGNLRVVGRTPHARWDPIGGKLFDFFCTIYKTITGAISRYLSQGARRATGRKQRGLPSDQCGSEPDEKPITVISQVNDSGFVRKQVSEGAHI